MPLKTSRTTVRRLPKRAHYDFDTIADILDSGFICHLGFVSDGQPYVIPTGYGRDGDMLYVHGSAVSRTLKAVAGGIPVCITVTHLDGLVLARSGFHSSMNYRSAVILGKAEPVLDDKLRALEIISEQILPGRWAELRPTTRKELNATTVLKLPITEASAKIRTGPPADDDEDYALPIWGGVVPLALIAGKPEHDGKGVPMPAPKYLAKYRKK